MGQAAAQFQQLGGRPVGNQPMGGQLMAPMGAAPFGGNFSEEIMFIEEVTAISLLLPKMNGFQRGVAPGFGRGAPGQSQVTLIRIKCKQNDRLEKAASSSYDATPSAATTGLPAAADGSCPTHGTPSWLLRDTKWYSARIPGWCLL